MSVGRVIASVYLTAVVVVVAMVLAAVGLVKLLRLVDRWSPLKSLAEIRLFVRLFIRGGDDGRRFVRLFIRGGDDGRRFVRLFIRGGDDGRP